MGRARWVLCWLIGLLGNAPAAPAQSGRGTRAQPADELPALARRTRQQAGQQAFDRLTLPLYCRALRLAQAAPNDTLLGQNAYYAGRSYFEIGRPDSAAGWLRLGQRASMAGHDTAQAVQTANYLLLAYTSQARPDSVRAVVGWLRALYPHTRPGTRPRDTMNGTLGGYCQDEGQYALALRYRLAQLAYRRQHAEPARVGVTLTNIGELFYLQGQLRPALKYRLEGLRLVQTDPSRRGTLPQLYALLGKTYRDLGRLDSARLHYETALRLLRQPADHPDEAAFLHSELSMVLGLQGRLALARQHVGQALAFAAQSQDLDRQAQVFYYAGEVELRAKNYAAARTYLRRAYALAGQLQSLDRREPIARLLAQAEAGAGHYAEAYRLRDASAALLDSAHNLAGQQAMAAMEARYQNQDKQRQIGLLNADRRLRVAQAAAQRRSLYLALAGVAALLLLVGLIGFLLRQRQRTVAQLAALNQRLNGSNAQLAEANRTKAKLFSVISHDLREPVGNLLHLLEVEAEAPDLLDAATRQEQIGYLHQSARDLLGTMDELLAWSKDQLDYLDPVPESVALAPLLAELAALYAPLARRKTVDLTVQCPPGLRLHTDPNFLRVIVRNLVQNALKFTPAGGTVRLVAAPAAGGKVRLEVQDTGPGLGPEHLRWLQTAAAAAAPLPAAGPAAGPGHGLGLGLTREFVAKLGGVLAVRSEPGQGTVFGVEL